MCALCGVLGGAGHWTEAAPRPGVFTRNTSSFDRRRQRLELTACAGRVLRCYGLSITDWQGSAYVLSTATGKTEIVESLAHLWPAAERLIGRPCDPLDPALFERLEGPGG
jgi:hypothetical protein